ncbi:MAG: hypothetical protein ABIP77_07175 [Candidatus Limnocylindrales bacterium]
MARPKPEVVHVGSATRDIASDDPRGWRLGGGVTYASLTTARLGLATAALMGLDDQAATAQELDLLEDAGVEVIRVPLAEGPVFHNVDLPTGRIQRCVTVGTALPTTAIPASWQGARAWSLVPVADELGDEWASVPDDGALVAVAWQGMLRTLRSGRTVTRRNPMERALVRRADLVGVSQQDVAPGTAPVALVALLKPGARLLLTQGATGGVMVRLDPADEDPPWSVRYLPTPGDREVDATGAGDTFLAALLAATIRPSLLGPYRRRRGADLHFTAAAGSLTAEDLGLAGVPDLSRVQARATQHRLRRLVVPLDASEPVSPAATPA